VQQAALNSRDQRSIAVIHRTVKPRPHQQQCRSSIVETRSNWQLYCMLLRHCCWSGRGLICLNRWSLSASGIIYRHFSSPGKAVSPASVS